MKVGQIRFTGNQHLSALQLRRAMKNLKPVGIPYSLIFENLFAKTFDASKLEEDTERVRQAYRDKGYYNAAVEEPKTQIRDEGGLNFFTFRPNKGKRIDILMPVEEGARYRLGTITFTGNKAVSNVRALRATFAEKDGDWFNATLIGKGLDNLKKAYGQLGYTNFAAIPRPVFDEQKKTVSLTVDIDEGKPFYVSRIEFQGNTITRDKVIRRELMLDEGQVYNSQLWEYSLLRLNQLEYFDPLKVDQDTEVHQDSDAGTVDLLLKVKEKGKNSIGLNGGVSGLSGAFLGVNYQTNNFLGLGRDAEPAGQPGQREPAVPVWFLAALSAQPSVEPGLPALQQQAGLQRRQELPGYRRRIGQPELGTAVLDAELQPGVDRLELLAQLPAEASRIPARGLHLFAEQVVDHRVQHGIADLLPDHQLPVGHSRLQCAGGHRHQFGVVYLHLQHHQQPDASRTGKEFTAAFQWPASAAMCVTSRRWWPTRASGRCIT